jgi:glucose-1-phosphate adenylyltransferase
MISNGIYDVCTAVSSPGAGPERRRPSTYPDLVPPALLLAVDGSPLFTCPARALPLASSPPILCIVLACSRSIAAPDAAACTARLSSVSANRGQRVAGAARAPAARRASIRTSASVEITDTTKQTVSSGPSDQTIYDMSKTVLGIILGGGAGSRLYPLTKKRAKPAVPLGANYRLIDIPVSNCINSGVNKIYCLTQFNSASLNRHLSQAYNASVGGYTNRGFVEVLAASQTTSSKEWFQGTADAVRQYLWLFEEACRDGIEDFLILSGDHLYRMDYSQFVLAHRQAGADITVAALPCAEKEAEAFGLMKIDDSGKIVEFAEKPKGDALRAMQVDTTVLGLDPEQAKEKPYIASMGIYVCKASALNELLGKHFQSEHDFGNDIIPGAKDMGMRVQAHLYDGYWEDIGTVKAFYDANLALTDTPNPAFSFYDKDAPIYTMSRFLPPSKVLDATVERSIIGDGCVIDSGSSVVHSVIGLRSRIGKDCKIEDSLLMGSDYYEQAGECDVYSDCLPIGVGRGTEIKGAIVDKNARIGRHCRIVNVDNVQEAMREDEGYVIRDGVIVIVKDATIPDGTII